MTSGLKYAEEQREEGSRDIKGTRLNYVGPRNDLLKVRAPRAAFQRLAGTYLTWEGFFLSRVKYLLMKRLLFLATGLKSRQKNIVSQLHWFQLLPWSGLMESAERTLPGWVSKLHTLITPSSPVSDYLSSGIKIQARRGCSTINYP